MRRHRREVGHRPRVDDVQLDLRLRRPCVRRPRRRRRRARPNLRRRRRRRGYRGALPAVVAVAVGRRQDEVPDDAPLDAAVVDDHGALPLLAAVVRDHALVRAAADAAAAASEEVEVLPQRVAPVDAEDVREEVLLGVEPAPDRGLGQSRLPESGGGGRLSPATSPPLLLPVFLRILVTISGEIYL